MSSPVKSTNTSMTITFTEIEALIDQIPALGERWDSAIDATVRIINAAQAGDEISLRRLAREGGALQKRLAALAAAFLEQGDVLSAMAGPQLALGYFFRFSRQYGSAWRSWIAEKRYRL